MAVSMNGLDLSFLKNSPPIKDDTPKVARKPWGARSDLPCPRIVLDRLEFRSMVDGSVITSKSHYREHLKRHGYTVVGNDIPKPESKEVKRQRRKKQIKNDLREAIQMHEQGYRNAPLESADKFGVQVSTDGQVTTSTPKEPLLTAH